MADDFVRDIDPLTHVMPVRPHPSNVRQERKRRRGEGKKGARDQEQDESHKEHSSNKDKVTFSKKKAGFEGDQSKPSPDKVKVTEKGLKNSLKHIDIHI